MRAAKGNSKRRSSSKRSETMPHAVPSKSPAQRAAELQSVLMSRIDDNDVQQIVDKLVSKAKAGDIAAAREVFDRAMGRAKQSVDIAATVQAQEAQTKSPDRWEYLRTMFDFYSRFMVPKRVWIPGVLRQYQAWQSGNGNGHRPADWDQITEQVEARCNWIFMTPDAAKDWRTQTMIYDGKALMTDTSRRDIAGMQ